MKKYFIAAMIGLIMLGTAFGTSNAQATSVGVTLGKVAPKTIISSGFPCNMIDQNGAFFQTTQSTATPFKLVCTANLQYWTKDTSITWNAGNTGVSCSNVNGAVTNNWSETIYPQGFARLVCYFSGQTAPSN